MNSDSRHVDIATLQQAKPYLRSALAFILYVRYGLKGIDGCYHDAEQFINRLEADIRSGK